MRIIDTMRDILRVPELRRRILITMGLLVIYRIGCWLPIPGVNISAIAGIAEEMTKTAGATVIGWFSVFSGGAFASCALFSLGIMPYISASIIFQLLIKVVPALEELAKEGPVGYRKINQYTRYATLPICIIQSIFLVKWLQMFSREGVVLIPADPWYFTLVAILTLTAGAMLLMWIGELITEYGVGNGASLIIMVGIIAQFPGAVALLYHEHQRDFGVLAQKLGILVVLYILVVLGIVYITQAQRRIPIQQAKHTRGRRVYGGLKHYVPLRVNQAGVMPVIFASALLTLPIVIGSATGLKQLEDLFSRASWWYAVIYIALIFFFSYFWTALMFQPSEMANNLKEYGSFIPGIRPGRRTAEYLNDIMVRVTLCGATFLCAIALIPDVVSANLGMEDYLAAFLGGTGVLIVVGVALDLVQKMESHLFMRHYEGFLGSGRIKGRRGL